MNSQGEQLNELALFAGAGGGILASQLLGHRVVCAVERDAYAAQVLAQRQNDGILRPFPIWSDVTTFDPAPWARIVDIVSAGFPCQDISIAGKGAGISGERSGLWSEVRRIVRAIRPQRVELENSPMLTFRGLGTVLGDLAALGYDAQWGVISASEVGAPHVRERIWIVAQRRAKLHLPDDFGREAISDPECGEQEVERHDAGMGGELELDAPAPGDCAGTTGAGVGGVADGLAGRMDRLKALGNGQVPRVAAAAWQILASE